MFGDTRFDVQVHSVMMQLADNFPLQPIPVEDTLAGVTAAAVELIDGVDHADVLLIDGDQCDSMAPTAPVAKELDTIQLQLQQGPCLQAAVADAVIRSPDLRVEQRWPHFAAAAINLGIFRVISFQLYTHHRGAGALNLLSRTAGAFTHEAEALGAMLATHAALALAAASTRQQFASALSTRDHIGQAKGILMERFNIDAVRAFEILKQLSQQTNTPLRELALRVIEQR
jgi:transcriptional regulator with GAF, ATPase, and Fis domain